MDKFEQLKREFDMLQNACSDFLEPGGANEFEYYIETVMVRLWSANGRYSDDYGTAIKAISGRERTPVQITRAMLDSIEPAEMSKIPVFFAKMVAYDFENDTRRTKNFVGDLKSLLAGAAFINGDFTIEESNMLSAELKKLMTYAISQGVKVDYATGRIRTSVTPLKEDSYVGPDTQASVSADLMFDALDRDFLRPGGGASGGGAGGSFRNGAGGGLGRGGGSNIGGRSNAGGNSNNTGSGASGTNGTDPTSGISIFDRPTDSGNTSGRGSSGVYGELNSAVPGSDSHGDHGDHGDHSGHGVYGGSPTDPSADPNQPSAPADPYAIKSTVEIKEDPRTMEELMAELDSLVGLAGIKEDIHSLMNFITITKLRQERGLNVPTMSYHLVFTGNPGTGKTTVARLVAGLYHRIGILPKGQLVETDRSQLIAGYTGQTALKTMDVINQAMGGVLFIDEAYALVNDDQDSFGKEAVETILKAMEDHRDELIVIVAGYTELMHKFIESNPGFRSRFSKFFEFPDYSGEELLRIFQSFCEKSGYHLTDEAEAYLLLQFNDMYEHRSAHFGNGRTARNIFEKAVNQQANRLAGLVNAPGALPSAETPHAKAGNTPSAPAPDAAADRNSDSSGVSNAPALDAEADGCSDSSSCTDATTLDAVANGKSDSSGASNAPALDAAADGCSDSSGDATITADSVTNEQLQELIKEDLEAAVEAERRKDRISDPVL